MASGNGSWSPTTAGNNRGRLEWQIDQSPSSVGAGTSSVSLRLRVWYRSRYSVSDSSNTYTISGSWSGSGSRSISHGGSGGRTLLYDGTITVPTSYSGTVSRNFTASFTGINATPNIPNVSGSHTVARRPISKPNAPTNVSATRVNDGRVNVSWTRNPTTARPYTYQRVQKRTYTDSGWSSWGTSSRILGSATSYTSTAIAPNRAYEFRVQAINSAGNTLSSVSGTVRTTPAAPSNVQAKKLSGGDIRVSWTRRHPFGSTHYLVEGRAGSGSWTQLGTASSESFTHVDPDPSSPWSYRVRARVTSPQTLTGAYSAVSNTVQLLAAPNAPTLLGPSGVVDRDERVRFAWRHNPVDTSDQEFREIQRRWQGDSSWSNALSKNAGSDEFYLTNNPYETSGVMEFRVRTWGAHPDPSPWSSVGSFQLGAVPTVAINEPFGVLDQSRVDVVIGYDNPDNSPQARATAELLLGGSVVETIQLGRSDSGSFTTALDNDTEYSVRVRVQAANGLWSEWDQVTFVTEFPAPVRFEVNAEWDRSAGSVSLSAGGSVDTESQFVWDGVPNNSTSTATLEEGTFTNRVTNPRGRTLVSLPAPSVEALNAVSVTGSGLTEFAKDADEITHTASTVKMLTAYTVRQTITDEMLDDIIEVIYEDTLDNSSADLQPGDLITYRDALHALLLPSGNDAAWCMARHVGEILSPGVSDPAERFVQEMNTIAVERFGWSGHSIPHPAGRAQASPRQVSAVALGIYDEDPLLVEIMGKPHYDIIVTGPNARVHHVSHTMERYQNLLPGLIGGKTGSGDTWVALSVLWMHPDGEVRATTIQRTVRERRYSDMENIIRSLSPEMVLVEGWPLADPFFLDEELNTARASWSDADVTFEDGVARVTSEGHLRFWPASGLSNERGFARVPNTYVFFGAQVRVTGGEATFRMRWAWAAGASAAWDGWERFTQADEDGWEVINGSRAGNTYSGRPHAYVAIQVESIDPGAELHVRNPGVMHTPPAPHSDPDLSHGWLGGGTVAGMLGPVPAGWDVGDGAVLYYSQSRDALALRITDSDGWSVMTGTPQAPSTIDPATYLTHIVDSTAGADLVVGASGGAPTTSDTIHVPQGGAVMRWVREDGVNAGANFRPIRFPSRSAAEEAIGATFYFRALLTEGEYDGVWFDGNTQSALPAEFLTFQRRDGEDLPWVTVADRVGPGSEVIDPTPALGAPEYRIVSHTDLPSSSTGPVTVVPWVHAGSGDPVFVNTGDGYGTVGVAYGSQAGDKPTIEQSSTHFAGIDFPVAIFGDSSDHSTSFTGTIHNYLVEKGATTRQEWINILNQRQVVCYRDCQGRKLYGLLDLDFSQSGPVETVSITVNKVWHEEGVTT